MQDYLTGDTGGPRDNATRLGVTTAQVIEISTLLTNYTTQYNIYTDPLQHTSAVIAAMKTQYETAMTYILAFRQSVKHSTVEKTANDYSALYIHADKPTRTPSEHPTDDDFHLLDWVGRGRFDIVFAPAHVRCCYVSARGEKGLLSPILSTPIV